ncbi:Uncharacterized phage-encoded [Paramuricea clavata]|uniref:Uncharacterized phage-encoded n=1 Tax=Paramuricea clavata TaxID=317549 RepID=A0A7D9ESW3_PARCT|nr:Uncharacterized phage-encoded [Paramuricea clavata]
MNKLFRNPDLNVSVRTIMCGDEILFYAKDVAESLGYSNPKKAVQVNVWNKNKVKLRELGGGTLKGPTCVWNTGKVTPRELRDGTLKGPIISSHPNCVFLREQGLYQLIFKSRLPIAEAFQDWVVTDVLPSIRKTGLYKLPEPEPLYCNQMRLINETVLHYAVVEYLKDYHPKALILPGLGKYQDTSRKRCDAWNKGYLGGQPDLTIVTPCNGFRGFAIELKTPKGTGELRDNQVAWIRELGKNGFRTLISNNYTEIVLYIDEYFRVDNTKKLVNEIENLKIKCKTLESSKCKEVVIKRIGYTPGKY